MHAKEARNNRKALALSYRDAFSRVELGRYPNILRHPTELLMANTPGHVFVQVMGNCFSLCR
jgi:hypothetical protein